MKYENFEQIKTIVSKIHEQEDKLKILKQHPDVKVINRFNGDFVLIQTYGFEDMSGHATDFITILINDAKTRIIAFKIQLDKL